MYTALYSIDPLGALHVSRTNPVDNKLNRSMPTKFIGSLIRK